MNKGSDELVFPLESAIAAWKSVQNDITPIHCVLVREKTLTNFPQVIHPSRRTIDTVGQNSLCTFFVQAEGQLRHRVVGKNKGVAAIVGNGLSKVESNTKCENRRI